MKVAITGTSRGLGKYLKLRMEDPPVLRRHEYTVHPVRARLENTEELCDEVVKSGADVFINNAHDGYLQADVFYAMFQRWKSNQGKYIINIGSRASNPNISRGYEYSASKY